MGKDIFDMINDSEIDLDNYEKVELNDIEKMKMKKFLKIKERKKNNKMKKVIKAAALVTVLGGGLLLTPLGQEVFANIELATYKLGDVMGIDKDLDDYKTVVEKSVTDKGITLKVNEVILDGSELIVSTTSYIEDGENQYMGLFGDATVYMNGKRVSGGASGSSGEVSKNTFAAEEFYDIESIDKLNLNKPIDVKIKFNSFSATPKVKEGEVCKPKIKKGNWEFNFIISPKELIAQTTTKTINKKVNIDNKGEVEIKEYTYNEVGHKIYIKFSEGLLREYSARFVGKDNLGNEVSFEGGYNGPEGGMLRLEKLPTTLSDDATEVKLQLQLAKFPKESGEFNSVYVNYGEEFTIKLK